MLLMIDNYDSFTYNVVQYLRELGTAVDVARNDEITLDEIADAQPARIAISPVRARPTKPASPWPWSNASRARSPSSASASDTSASARCSGVTWCALAR